VALSLALSLRFLFVFSAFFRERDIYLETYIYIQRETYRERERHRERERDKERERERERESLLGTEFTRYCDQTRKSTFRKEFEPEQKDSLRYESGLSRLKNSV
jgi:hypothetical protein